MSPGKAVWAVGAPVLFLFFAALHCAASDLETVLARMERAEAETRTLSFDFLQTADVRLTGEKQKIKGKASFKRPDRFRVEHTAPREQTIVSDGKTLWFYDPGQNQVLVDTWENWAKSAGFPKGLMPFQTDVAGLKEKYRISFEGRGKAGGKSGAILRLEPREPGPWSYNFRIWVDESTGLPFQTELDTQGVKAVTALTRVAVNPDLQEDVFVLKIPEGTRVLGVRERMESLP